MPSYEAAKARFEGLNAQVLGISVDHIPCLQAWAESLGGITYPLLSDFWPHGQVAEQFGVLRSEGYSERAIFIIDRYGCVQYIDVHDIDQQPENEELFKVLRRLEPEAAEAEDWKRLKTQGPAGIPESGIVLYCTSWCPMCKRARAWLEQHQLPFTEIDIDKHPEGRERVRKYANGNLTTPTFDIDGTVIVDFQEQRLNEVLKDRISKG